MEELSVVPLVWTAHYLVIFRLQTICRAGARLSKMAYFRKVLDPDGSLAISYQGNSFNVFMNLWNGETVEVISHPLDPS